MTRHIRKKGKTLAQARHEAANGPDVKTGAGVPVKQPNPANTRKYSRAIPDGLEPLMRQAYSCLQEKRFKSPGSIRTMQRQNRDQSKCYKAAWLSEHRGFSEDRCLLFPGFVPHRTVRVKFNYRNMAAAEAMCLMALGSPPSTEHVAAHKCGNGHLSCVNPQHLYWADAKQNARDRVLHDPNTLPVEGVSEADLKAIAQDKRLNAVIAWEYGVPISQVKAIKE